MEVYYKGDTETYKGYRLSWGRGGTSLSCPALMRYGVYGYTRESQARAHIDRLIRSGKIKDRTENTGA